MNKRALRFALILVAGCLLLLACVEDILEGLMTPTPELTLTNNGDEEMKTATPSPTAHGRPSILVGAIRWDAWHGELGMPGMAVEMSLGPEHWHYRLPFFAEVISDTRVSIRGDTQTVMDQEILYASQAGLDYWAFVTYNENDPMSLGIQRYFSSAEKHKINFCMIVEGARIGSGGLDAWPAKMERYLRYFADPSYQKVLDGRPLFYIFNGQPVVADGAFASFDDARTAFKMLRDASIAAGTGDPYIVIQSWSEGQAKLFMDFFRADAISAYASSGGDKNAPYAALAAHTEAWWDAMAATGAPVIPLVSAGWDRRPRVENPVPWEGQQGSLEEYYERPTPEELAAHLQAGLTWVDTHPESAPVRAVLIYAWNENDEGGWIVPTLSEGTAHLDAIADVLAQR